MRILQIAWGMGKQVLSAGALKSLHFLRAREPGRRHGPRDGPGAGRGHFVAGGSEAGEGGYRRSKEN